MAGDLDHGEGEEIAAAAGGEEVHVDEKLSGQMSEASICETEDDDEEDGKVLPPPLDLGPQCSLKDQLEKDKDDESLRRWKEQLLGSVDLNSVGGNGLDGQSSHYLSRELSNLIIKYINTVWKTGVKVDTTKEMLGTLGPQQEPYTHVMAEETTPSGMFARGTYSAKSKFVDDDNKCYLEINYTFAIKRDWAASN